MLPGEAQATGLLQLKPGRQHPRCSRGEVAPRRDQRGRPRPASGCCHCQARWTATVSTWETGRWSWRATDSARLSIWGGGNMPCRGHGGSSAAGASGAVTSPDGHRGAPGAVRNPGQSPTPCADGGKARPPGMGCLSDCKHGPQETVRSAIHSLC